MARPAQLVELVSIIDHGVSGRLLTVHAWRPMLEGLTIGKKFEAAGQVWTVQRILDTTRKQRSRVRTRRRRPQKEITADARHRSERPDRETAA